MNETVYVYIVHSDINENNIYAEFRTEAEAIEYAKEHEDELTYVDKVEVALDEDGEISEMFDSETIWVYGEDDEDEDGWAVCVVTTDDGDSDWEYFDSEYEARDYYANYTSYERGREVEVQLYGPDGLEDSYIIDDDDEDDDLDESIKLRTDAEREEFFRLCDEIGIITARDIDNFKKEVGCTDENILQALRDYRAELGPDFKIANPELEREMANKYEDFDSLVETLEENEDIVECKECFELFPKQDCIKIEIGYVCPECGKVHSCCMDNEEEFEIDSIPDVVVADDDFFKVDFPELERTEFRNDMIPDEPTPEVENDPISEPECVGPEGEAPVETPVTKDEVIDVLVRDEEDAIAGYDNAEDQIDSISDLPSEEKEEIKDVLDHIREEEIEHIEELEELVGKDTAEPLTETIADAFKGLGDLFRKGGNVVKDFFKVGWNAVGGSKMTLDDFYSPEGKHNTNKEHGNGYIVYGYTEKKEKVQQQNFIKLGKAYDYALETSKALGKNALAVIEIADYKDEGKPILAIFKDGSITPKTKDIILTKANALSKELTQLDRQKAHQEKANKLKGGKKDETPETTNEDELLNNNQPNEVQNDTNVNNTDNNDQEQNTNDQNDQEVNNDQNDQDQTNNDQEQTNSEQNDQEVVNNSEVSDTDATEVPNTTVKPKNAAAVQANKEYNKIIKVLKKIGLTDSEIAKYIQGKKPTDALKELRKLLFTESLEEHINKEHPAIESDQELKGTDNAVVDCEVADIIAHSEDEKPLDCEMKKASLEKPLAEEYVAPGSREFMSLGETMYVALRLLYLNMKTEADAVDIIQDARRFGYEPEEIEVLEDLISFVFEHFYNNIESAAEFKRNIIKGWQVNKVNNIDEKAKRELYGIISKFSRTQTKKQELLFQAINTLVLEFL